MNVFVRVTKCDTCMSDVIHAYVMCYVHVLTHMCMCMCRGAGNVCRQKLAQVIIYVSGVSRDLAYGRT